MRDAEALGDVADRDLPSVPMTRVNPVGANASGSAEGCPRMVVDVSTFETSRSTSGTSSTRANAWRARMSAVSSWPAAPSV